MNSMESKVEAIKWGLWISFEPGYKKIQLHSDFIGAIILIFRSDTQYQPWDENIKIIRDLLTANCKGGIDHSHHEELQWPDTLYTTANRNLQRYTFKLPIRNYKWILN